MKNLKRVLAFVLAAMLTVTVIGCKKPGNEESKGVVLEDVEGTVKLVIGISDDPLVEDFDTNYLTKLIEERYDVEIEFMYLPYDTKERAQKIELMMVAGENLPDIILSEFSFESAALYGEMGMIVPLNDYVDSMTLLKANIASMKSAPIEYETYLKYCRSNDGKIYGFGDLSMTPNNSVSAGRLMVYGPWVEAYQKATGAGEIVTTEDFKNYLIYVRDHDMNGNGDSSDEFPLLGFSSSITNNILLALMNPFIYTQGDYLYNNGGKVEYSAISDKYKEGLKYIKSLYDEGLLDGLTFTQDKASFTSILNSKETVVGTLAWISASYIKAADSRREEYQVLGALQGPDGTRNATVQPNIPKELNVVITKDCEYLARALKVVDFIMSEEFCTIDRYGIEGENYVVLTGSDVGESIYGSMGFAGDILSTNTIWGNVNNIQWHAAGVVMNDGSAFTLREKDVAVAGNYNHSRPIGKGIMKELNYRNTENAIFGLLYTTEEQEVVTEYKSSLISIVQEYFANFITGKANIDTDWNKYVNAVKANGLDSYLAAVQSAFDRLNK